MTEPLRVLIVDDEPLARAHLRSMLEARDDLRIVGECGDGRAAIERIRSDPPDLVLLDVQMPERSGLDVAREVGPESMPITVFVTAYDEHALSAFEVHALDYVLKPVNRRRLMQTIDRARALQQATAERAATLTAVLSEPRVGADRLAVKVGERLLFLRINDIDWIEASGDIARLHVGRHAYDHRITLTQLEARLPADRFVRIHRSTIVNADRIVEFHPWFQGDWVLVLADGTRVQSGKSYRARVRKLIEG